MIATKAESPAPKKHASLIRSLPAIASLARPYWRSLLLGAVLIALSQVARLVLPYSSKYLMDTVVLKHQASRLLPLIAIVFSAIAVHAGAFFAVSIILATAGTKLMNDLRRRVQLHIAHLPIGYFDSNLSGTLVTRIMTDSEGMLNLVGPAMLDFCASLLTGSVTLFLLMSKSCRLTLILLCVLFVGAVVLYRSFSRVRPLMRDQSKIRAEVSGRLTESIGGIRVVKGYRAEKREAHVFAAGLQRLFKNSMRMRPGMSTIQSTGILLTGLSTLAVMLFGGRWLLDSRWTVGDYVQYAALITYIVNPVFMLVNIGTLFTQAVAGLDRIGEVLGESIEDADRARIIALPPIDGEVRFDDVSFAYEQDQPVLHHVSFQAAPGTVTALVGPSGSGKSTIISLLCAFHRPQSGRVLIDNVDLASVALDSYRTQLGLVLQETFLFDGTVSENLVFARPDASEEEMLDACRMACVDEFAEKLPKRYETVVGERGVKLSGGQKQRVSIARAILANPRILILDEATSSLDSESEAMIQEGLSYLMQGRTTFVIAHRLSTIRRAHQILVLEEGKILERGTHPSLYEKQGRYYDLYTRQYGLERNLFLAPMEGDDPLESQLESA
jgi:ABC-type multidrug transport system fused ATPase/permease subunit